MIGNAALQYESHGNKSFITYELKEQDEIDRTEMEMLRLNKIPGLLTFNMMQADGRMTCCYDITSLTKMQGMLAKTMDRQQLFKLLEQMVKTMETAEDYMLNTEHFMLNMEYLYMQPGEKEIYFILLPVKQKEAEFISFQEFLKGLLSNIQYDSRQDGGDFFIKVMNYVNSVQTINPHEFRQKIYQFMGMMKPSSKARTDEVKMDAGIPEHKKPANVMPSSVPVSQPTPVKEKQEAYFVQKRSMGSKEMKKGLFGRSVSYGEEKQDKKQKEPKKENKKEVRKKKQQDMDIAGMAVPGMAIPGMEIPDINTNAGTNAAADTFSDFVEAPAKEKEKKKKHFLFHKKEEEMGAANGPIPRKPAASQKISTPVEEMAASAMQIPGLQQGQQAPVIPAMQQGQQAPVATGTQPGQSASGQGAQPAPILRASQIMAGGNNDQEIPGTVLMEEMGDANPFLEYARTGERVYLTKDYFQIGRDPSYVDHVVDNPTVGRIHAFLISRGDQYYIVDNNSKNGTRIDRNRIASNQEHALQDGCQVEMGTEKFYFYSR